MLSTENKIKWQKCWDDPCVLEYAIYNFQEAIKTTLNKKKLKYSDNEWKLENSSREIETNKQPNKNSKTEKFSIQNISKTLNRLYHKIDQQRKE